MKLILIALFSSICISSVAQRTLEIEFGELDSAQLNLQRQVEYKQFIHGAFGKEYLLQELRLPTFKLPQQYKENYSLGLGSFSFTPYYEQFSPFVFGGISPLFFNGKILSEASYKLGNKLILGGFSYGENSLLTPAAFNPTNNTFDTYGSTLFMQYKVSKSLKIETRVSIGQQKGKRPPFLSQ